MCLGTCVISSRFLPQGGNILSTDSSISCNSDHMDDKISSTDVGLISITNALIAIDAMRLGGPYCDLIVRGCLLFGVTGTKITAGEYFLHNDISSLW